MTREISTATESASPLSTPKGTYLISHVKMDVHPIAGFFSQTAPNMLSRRPNTLMRAAIRPALKP
ncbi:hypothetical protein [Rhodopirellula sp. SWK7]|uniref:hypothetical protein n=1 Tax=Rhodopirellula sp. SWK7 TaxID=595460 RepID=UPI001F1A1B2C|nr:hypothetical protein [Rhodopirellula sp. SWK7]